MKNSKSIIAIIVLAILATIVTVVSCKKEKQEQKSYNAEQSVQCSDNMDEYLISFKNKLLSAQKGEETISLEQAQRDLGNLLNFDFGDANYPTNMYQVDSIHAKLTLTQGKVDLSQLAITYKETFDTILQTYHSIDLPEKSISSISCTFCENENKTNEEETVEVEIVVVTRGLGDTPFPSNNHDNFDWRPKNNAGTCDGQFVGQKGAPEILEQWIIQSQGTPTCPNGGRVYYIDVDHFIILGYHYYDPIASRFKVYTSFETNQNLVCIPHEDMEYYYNNILDIFHQQSFGTHHINYIHIVHGHFLNIYFEHLNEHRNVYSWEITIRHGKPTCTDIPAPLD